MPPEKKHFFSDFAESVRIHPDESGRLYAPVRRLNIQLIIAIILFFSQTVFFIYTLGAEKEKFASQIALLTLQLTRIEAAIHDIPQLTIDVAILKMQMKSREDK